MDDLQKPFNVLIEEMKTLASQTGSNNLHFQNLGKIIAKFTCVLLKLGDRAEKFTWWLIGLTIALALVALVQTVIMICNGH